MEAAGRLADTTRAQAGDLFVQLYWLQEEDRLGEIDFAAVAWAAQQVRRFMLHSCTRRRKAMLAAPPTTPSRSRIAARRLLRAAAPATAVGMGFAAPVVTEVIESSASRPEKWLAALSGLACGSARAPAPQDAPTRDAAHACPASPPTAC